MKRRKNITPAIRDHWVDQWERALERGTYQPFLRAADVPSYGNKAHLRGVTTGRVHHLLSRNETLQFLVLDADPDVVDIQEQFPLLPLSLCVAYAKHLGIPYPRYRGTRTNIVLTVDLIAIYKDGRRAVKSVKPAGELSKRTQEKLLLEEAVCRRLGMSWDLVTATDLRVSEIENLQAFHQFGRRHPAVRSDEWVVTLCAWRAAFKDCLGKLEQADLGQVLDAVGRAISISSALSNELFRYCVWHRYIPYDFKKPFALNRQPADLGVVLS